MTHQIEVKAQASQAWIRHLPHVRFQARQARIRHLPHVRFEARQAWIRHLPHVKPGGKAGTPPHVTHVPHVKPNGRSTREGRDPSARDARAAREAQRPFEAREGPLRT